MRQMVTAMAGAALALPGLAAGQANPAAMIDAGRLQRPAINRLPTDPGALARLTYIATVPLQLSISGQGTLSVGDQTCTSDPAKD